MKPLWDKHFSETADKFYGDLNPRLDIYESCAAAGTLAIYTMRDAYELVGYQVFIVTNHLHSQEMIQATQDILFIDPQYRKGLAALKFIRWCGEQLRGDGVDVLHQVVPYKKNYGALFERLGYQAEDIIYSKLLTEVN